MLCPPTLVVGLLFGYVFAIVIVLQAVYVTANPLLLDRQRALHAALDQELPEPEWEKRSSDHVITECMDVRSDEGVYYYKAGADWEEGKVCGLYLFADPDKRIEVHFVYVDVPCQKGGLVSFVDGWELNGQLFPSVDEHPRPAEQRFVEFCGRRKMQHAFVTAQNAALIQYRPPGRGAGFRLTVRFVKNPTPCHVLIQNIEEVYTLRNYGRASNCSMTALFPAAVRIEAMSVGLSGAANPNVEIETGIIHKCNKRGLEDYVQIGGSSGLDNRNFEAIDTICGMESQPENRSHTLFCEAVTVRLTSSGLFDNSVTVALRQATPEDLDSISHICAALTT